MESRQNTALPAELWLYIFSFLDAKSLVNAQLVCTLFNAIGGSESLWTALYEKQAPVQAIASYIKGDDNIAGREKFFGESYKTFFARHLPKDHLFAVVGPIEVLNRANLLSELRKKQKAQHQISFYITRKEAEENLLLNYHIIKIEHKDLSLKKWHYGNFHRLKYVATVNDELINKLSAILFPPKPVSRSNSSCRLS